MPDTNLRAAVRRYLGTVLAFVVVTALALSVSGTVRHTEVPPPVRLLDAVGDPPSGGAAAAGHSGDRSQRARRRARGRAERRREGPRRGAAGERGRNRRPAAPATAPSTGDDAEGTSDADGGPANDAGDD